MFLQSAKLIAFRFEHFGRCGGCLFCGTTNKRFLKFFKIDFVELRSRLFKAPLMKRKKVESVAVWRLCNYTLTMSRSPIKRLLSAHW